MIYYNLLVNQLKGSIATFSKKMANNLGKVENKFIMSFMFGIIKSQSTRLSDIGRALKEKNKLKNVVDKLGKNLEHLYKHLPTIWDNYYNQISPILKKAKTLSINIDLSDVIKDDAIKFENIDRVADGSDSHKVKNGYYVNEITATIDGKRVITLFSEIFSTLSKGYKSINTETLKALNKVFKYFGNIGICVLDRGYDSYLFFSYFLKRKWKFVIRGKNNRSVVYKGKKINIEKLAEKFKGRYNVKVKLKGKDVSARANFVEVTIDKVKVTVVFVYFKSDISIFYTNMEVLGKSGCLRVVYTYYMRWRIEEYFKYKKQQFDFEKFMVRSLKRMNSLNVLLSMALSWIDIIFKNKESKIYYYVEQAAQPIKELVFFHYYRIASGLKEMFGHCMCAMERWLATCSSKSRQLSLFDNFAET